MQISILFKTRQKKLNLICTHDKRGEVVPLVAAKSYFIHSMARGKIDNFCLVQLPV